MPSILTHYLCGKLTVEKMKSNNQSSFLFIDNYRQEFNLGTLGPDIFFFHNIWPWKKNKSIQLLGDLIHSKKVQVFFKNMYQYLISSPDKDLLISYFLGFCCHYVLDSTTHPYIIYKSGFDRSGELDKHYLNIHREFETNLDYFMSIEYEKTIPYNLNAPKLFNVNSVNLQKIAAMLETVINLTYGNCISSALIIESIKDMNKIIWLLRDKTGLKRKFSIFLENKLNLKTKASVVIYPLNLDNSSYYLNLDKRPWYLPWDNSKNYNETFHELFHLAINKTYEYFNGLIILDNPVFSKPTFWNEFGNNSYATGIDCDITVEFKFKAQ